jgi:hypothetical protein
MPAKRLLQWVTARSRLSASSKVCGEGAKVSVRRSARATGGFLGGDKTVSGAATVAACPGPGNVVVVIAV